MMKAYPRHHGDGSLSEPTDVQDVLSSGVDPSSAVCEDQTSDTFSIPSLEMFEGELSEMCARKLSDKLQTLKHSTCCCTLLHREFLREKVHLSAYLGAFKILL